MERLKAERTPKQDGFFMPAEFAPHHGCIMIWPERPGSWPDGAGPARKAFQKIIKTIAQSEHMYLAVGKNGKESAKEMLKDVQNLTLFEIETDDAWARDIGPTFLLDPAGERACVDWRFNAWGGEYNGLYASWEKDDAFAKEFVKKFGGSHFSFQKMYDAAPFVLEGGAIHSDGEGTVMVTEACLLSPGRNPGLNKEEITRYLCDYLGAEKVLWLPHGIYNDETDEHVDNVCAFVRPGEVVLAWAEDETDEQYPMSLADYEYLMKQTDAKGRPIRVHKLPVPRHPVRIKEEELSGYQFEEGEDVREAGERLAASYVNFYFSNDAVLLPVFGGENEESDQKAVSILAALCPERKLVTIPARDILLGGGNIHCITQQIPEGGSYV